jgi:hypothetical protein
VNKCGPDIDIFPAAKLQIITKTWTPTPMVVMDTCQMFSLVIIENGQVGSLQERDEYKNFKHLEDWANGSLMTVAIMLKVFKLPPQPSSGFTS